MTVAATVPHPDRLGDRARALPESRSDVALAVQHLVWLLAGSERDELTTLEAIGRAAARMCAERREVPMDEDRAVAAIGQWSLENGMLPHVVLGEN